MMSEIFATLLESQKANQLALDNLGRVAALQFAVVVDNDDPMQFRRIKVTLESKGNQVATNWLMPAAHNPYIDPPIPPIGSSVLVGFANGDPHDGFYFGNTINATNTPDDKQRDPVNDSTQVLPGESKVTVKKSEQRRTEADLTISVGKSIKIQNDAGAGLELTELGAIVLNDAFGHRIVLGGLSAGLGIATDVLLQMGGDATLNLGGDALNIINASDLTIAGKSVATVTAPDDDGDLLTARGW